MWKIIDRFKKVVDLGNLKGIPIGVSVTIFINVFFYSMARTVVFSFLPKMVKYFGASELKTGYYAGIIASSLFVGRLFFSMFWGYLTDTIGKKVSTLLTGLCLLITTLAFGFSRNFYWAIVTRFLQGCSMGQIIVSKSTVADVCDDNNMAAGLSVVMTAFSVGLIIGPSIGGFLVFPAEQYPQTFSMTGLFGKYGVLLPNLIIVIGLGVGITLTMSWLPNDKKKSSESTHLVKESCALSYGATKESIKLNDREYLSLNPSSSETLSEQNSPNVAISEFKGLSCMEKIRNSKFITVMKIKECILGSLLHGLFSVVDIGFSEMFPLLASTNKIYKGMEFSPSNIGTVLMIISAALIILQLTVLPKLNNIFGSKRVLIISNLILVFLCPMLPVISAITNKTFLWGSILLLMFFVRGCTFTAYLSINILVNNSVGSELLGSANGLAMTVASIGRLIAPVICGSLYSWSLTNIKGIGNDENALGFPFNQFLVFFFLSMWSIFIAVITSMLPEEMNFKKEVRKKESEPSTSVRSQ